jgi:hypothetical protein
LGRRRVTGDKTGPTDIVRQGLTFRLLRQWPGFRRTLPPTPLCAACRRPHNSNTAATAPLAPGDSGGGQLIAEVYAYGVLIDLKDRWKNDWADDSFNHEPVFDAQMPWVYGQNESDPPGAALRGAL